MHFKRCQRQNLASFLMVSTCKTWLSFETLGGTKFPNHSYIYI